ncbi:hypothetical protein B0H10DRAFT_2233550 [Mycena sp. CBHHK59/15]|nr:hypothetical protein B0H10DRAFT_2233550 [Mycena sp. CBHHK59/15]
MPSTQLHAPVSDRTLARSSPTRHVPLAGVPASMSSRAACERTGSLSDLARALGPAGYQCRPSYAQPPGAQGIPPALRRPRLASGRCLRHTLAPLPHLRSSARPNGPPNASDSGAAALPRVPASPHHRELGLSGCRAGDESTRARQRSAGCTHRDPRCCALASAAGLTPFATAPSRLHEYRGLALRVPTRALPRLRTDAALSAGIRGAACRAGAVLRARLLGCRRPCAGAESRHPALEGCLTTHQPHSVKSELKDSPERCRLDARLCSIGAERLDSAGDNANSTVPAVLRELAGRCVREQTRTSLALRVADVHRERRRIGLVFVGTRLLQFALRALAVGATPSKRSVVCSTSNAIVIDDCVNLINTHISDGTVVVGDTSFRAILTVGGCSIVQNFWGTRQETTAAVMA